MRYIRHRTLDTTLKPKIQASKPEISHIRCSEYQVEKKYHFGNAPKQEVQDLLHCQNLKGIKWGTICQAFFLYMICPSYLITAVLWIRYLGLLCLFVLSLSQTCNLYKWKVSIHLSLPFVLFLFSLPYTAVINKALKAKWCWWWHLFHPFVL